MKVSSSPITVWLYIVYRGLIRTPVLYVVAIAIGIMVAIKDATIGDNSLVDEYKALFWAAKQYLKRRKQRGGE